MREPVLYICENKGADQAVPACSQLSAIIVRYTFYFTIPNFIGFCSEKFPLPLGAYNMLCCFIVALPGPSVLKVDIHNVLIDFSLPVAK